MPSYHKNPDWGWEAVAANGLTGLVVMGVILVAALLATIIVILATEIARIYGSRAVGHDTPTARILWVALAALLGLLLIAGLLVSDPLTLAIGLYVAVWSFLAFVIVVEVCEWREGRLDGPEKEVTVDHVLTDWHYEPGPVSPNGHAEPVGATRR